MRILHTGDWHLGDRIGSRNPKIERHDDLGRSLRQIAGYLEKYEVDVMLVAGDVFSDYCHSSHDRLNKAIGQIREIFGSFLANGGTIVAVSGNHDNELIFDSLNQALSLVCQSRPAPEGCMPTGRPYLIAPGPAMRYPIRLAGRDGQIVQIVAMPYPSSRFLMANSDGSNASEQYRDMRTCYLQALQAVCKHLDPRYPSVLLSHLALDGVPVTHNRCLRADEDVIIATNDLTDRWHYAAYGHIHKAWPYDNEKQTKSTVRYCGSIERLDAGELNDEKSVVLFDVVPGQACRPVLLPLEVTAIYDLVFRDVDTELPEWLSKIPHPKQALVKYTLHHDPARQNRNDLCRRIEDAFPRWYTHDFPDEGSVALADAGKFQPQNLHDVYGTVMHFMEEQLDRLKEKTGNDDPDRETLLGVARELLAEQGFGNQQGQFLEAVVRAHETEQSIVTEPG